MTADVKRYYATLGVAPTCSDEEIRHAFRRRAKELHPDSETGDAGAFIRLKKAYDTLSDPGSRARYDRARLSRFRRRPPDGAPPPPRQTRAARPGGMSLKRYAAAFVFMAGLSYGAIQLMISMSDVPPSSTIRTGRPAATASAPPAPAERATTGFFDATTPDGSPRPPGAPPPARAPAAPDRNAAWPGR